MTKLSGSVIALDYGEVRIGVAIASFISLLPRPLTTLNNDKTLFTKIKEIIKEENVSLIIVGLPRNLNNVETSQTKIVKKFITELKNSIEVEVITKDEALTSVKAANELKKNKKPYTKAQIDALAATFILEDWVNEDYLNYIHDF